MSIQASSPDKNLLTCIERISIPDWGPGAFFGFDEEDSILFKFVVDAQGRAKVISEEDPKTEQLRGLILAGSLKKATFRRECIGTVFELKFAFRRRIQNRNVAFGFITWSFLAPHTIELLYEQ